MAKKGKNKVQKEPKKKKKAKQAPKVSPTPVPREPAVLVYPEEDGPKTAEELKALLKQNIRPAELHVKVTSVRKLKNEGVAICVTKSEDIDTLKKAIEEAKGLKGKCGVKEPSTRNPHILIFDVDKDTEEAEVTKALRKQFELPKGSAKVRSRLSARKGYEHWVVETTPALYKEIKACDKLSLGWSRHRYKEYLCPMRCYRCYRYGHTQKNCVERETEQLCSNCPGKHSYKECKEEKTSCRNCTEVNIKQRQKLDTAHSTMSRNCPCYVRELQLQRNRTTYG
ncbi:uncharacterized protein LOC118180268 [Stegodyphus dumicola]|uniref:uncharacterized protein LOC118180268 n=1 Tax=Stegodyphus dumicola TaxID=202533 RepID=UPI0015B06242|nr:uncharacterized protein LOC118180268 [Stegodyphus dumicola]